MKEHSINEKKKLLDRIFLEGSRSIFSKESNLFRAELVGIAPEHIRKDILKFNSWVDYCFLASRYYGVVKSEIFDNYYTIPILCFAESIRLGEVVYVYPSEVLKYISKTFSKDFKDFSEHLEVKWVKGEDGIYKTFIHCSMDVPINILMQVLQSESNDLKKSRNDLPSFSKSVGEKKEDICIESDSLKSVEDLKEKNIVCREDPDNSFDDYDVFFIENEFVMMEENDKNKQSKYDWIKIKEFIRDELEKSGTAKIEHLNLVLQNLEELFSSVLENPQIDKVQSLFNWLKKTFFDNQDFDHLRRAVKKIIGDLYGTCAIPKRKSFFDGGGFHFPVFGVEVFEIKEKYLKDTYSPMEGNRVENNTRLGSNFKPN